jgi:NADH-quinone oxidoreductase subunit E
MAQINYDYYEDLTAETFEKVLDGLAAGKKVKPGPQIDRQLSEPVGGPTTLTDKAIYKKTQSSQAPTEAAVLDNQAKKPGESANATRSGVPPSFQDKNKPKPN